MKTLLGSALLTAAAALALAGRAAATNLVLNPSFESQCAGAPCNWAPTGASVQVSSDSTTANSGSFSIAVGIGVSSTGIVSDCFDGVVGGQAAVSFAYETNDAATQGLEYSMSYYDGQNCSGFVSGGPSLKTTVAAGSWHQVAGTLTAPAGTQSAKIFLTRSCIGPCADDTTVRFDDVSFAAAGPTAASIRSFTATHSPAGTLLRWRTASEFEVAGFNVYRMEHGRRVKVNRHLIAARARGGASYRVLDRGHRAATYRLEVVNLDGTRQQHMTH